MGLGSNLGAFVGGFQASYSLRLLKEEKERNEKLAKEKEANAMNWYTTNKDSLANFQSQPQGTRNALLYESVLYSDDWHKTLRDFEDAIQNNDLEQAKHINDMLEEQLKIEGDMLEFGITADKGFIGKFYTPESMDYIKKLRMGALSNKPIGTHMYEEAGYGELPAEAPSPLSAKDNWAIDNYKAGKINFNQLSKYMGTYIEPEKATALEDKIAKAKEYGATNEDIKDMLVGKSVGAEATRVTSLPQLEKYREKALNADSLEERDSIVNDYREAGFDPAPLEEKVTDELWANVKKSDLDNLVAVLNEITAGTSNVKGNKTYSFEIDGEVAEQTGEEWFKQVYKSYVALLKLLEEQGIDISQYKKLKPLSEIKKAGRLKGIFTGGGVEMGDLPSIYY